MAETTEKPRVIVSRTRSIKQKPVEFAFIEDPIPAGVLHGFRAHAREIYGGLSFPSTTDEAWRRTDLSRFNPGSFSLIRVEGRKSKLELPRGLFVPITNQQSSGHLLNIDGWSTSRLGTAAKKNGVIFKPLVDAERENPELVTALAGKIIQSQEGKFSALAAAYANTGLLLYVPRNVHLDEPFYNILFGASSGFGHIYHVLVWLDEGASATLIQETSTGGKADSNLFAGNVEILVGKNASLKFLEMQTLGNTTWNFSHTRVRVEAGGNVDWMYGGLGSKVTKAFSELDLVGEGASGRMSGFYLTNGNQHLDLDTQQNHLAPRTSSDLLYKGALSGESRAVWQGMIYVAPGAQKTDGYQANRNLVLSQGARADSIPGLEILADDVRCTHGATVGKLDEDPFFYLQSRGIPEIDARWLLIEGFFDPILQRIPVPGTARRFSSRLRQKLDL